MARASWRYFEWNYTGATACGPVEERHAHGIQVSMNPVSVIEIVDTPDSRVSKEGNSIRIKRGSGARLVAYFKADPRCVLEEDCRYLLLDYMDKGTGRFFVEYDGPVSQNNAQYPWSTTDSVELVDSGSWRSVAFLLCGVRWTGSINNADFRIVAIDHTIHEFAVRNLRMALRPGDAALVASPETLFALHDRSTKRRLEFVKPSRHRPLELPAPCNPLCSIIVPVFNRLAYTIDCLRAIMEFTPPIYEVVVINDGSHDETNAYLSRIPGLRLITNTGNSGFAKSCNIGANEARGRWLVFLNNDTIPQFGWLSALVVTAERDPGAHVIGSKLIYPQTGRTQHAGISFDQSRLPRHDYEHSDPYDAEVCVDREVDAVTGACLLTERSRFTSLGGFDEGFVNGFEDIDYCLTVRKNQGRIIFCAKSIVMHYKSVSAGRLNTVADKSNTTRFRAKWDEFLLGNRYGEAMTLTHGHLPYVLNFNVDTIHSQTGERKDGNVLCRRNKHSPGHCIYGGYISIGGAIKAKAVFVIGAYKLPASGTTIVELDVYDNVSDTILSHGVVRAPDADLDVGRCPLDFIAYPGQVLEFRIFWHGNCDLVAYRVELRGD